MLHASRPRIALVAALIALVALTALAGAPSATAASSLSCAEQIVDDWYGDGRVDKIYPLKCYQAAIRSLPVDVLDYSRAEEDILRALQFARAGEPDPGPTGGAEPNDNDPGDETDAEHRRRRRPERPGRSGREAARPRRTSTRPARRPCRSRCSCSAGSHCSCSPPARSAISAAARRRAARATRPARPARPSAPLPGSGFRRRRERASPKMPVFRRVVVLLSLAWLVIAAPLASAGSLETCAQRVIRDWYSGGRVDGVYPLPCYRAAIKALPADVLAYSEADADIERALAFARRGRDSDGDRDRRGRARRDGRRRDGGRDGRGC